MLSLEWSLGGSWDSAVRATSPKILLDLACDFPVGFGLVIQAPGFDLPRM